MSKILILFSDTGGGHRAAAEAIREAIQTQHGTRHEIILADGIVRAAMPPFNLIPKLYFPTTQYSPWGWDRMFRLTNSRAGMYLLTTLTDLIAGRGLRHILQQHHPDLVLTVHPLLTHTPCHLLKQMNPHAPFITVVTDLFDAHAIWFSAPADVVIVPTEGAKARGLRWGIAAEQIRVVGLPVSLKFTPARQSQTDTDVSALRARLGLAPDRFTILIVGGGEGMGQIEQVTRALVNIGLPIQLVVIAGRNNLLKRKLLREYAQHEASTTQSATMEHLAVPVRVTGFVKNMPEWMCASDLVVTKAGPGTIMETLATGRPLILSGYLPGQETGNVTFVEQSGVGVFCKTPEQIATQVREWLRPGNEALTHLRARAREQARPDAALEIAQLLDALL